MRAPILAVGALLLAAPAVLAQDPAPCRILCTPELAVEPTITFKDLAGSPRVAEHDGAVSRRPQEVQFETILSLGVPTRVSWLKFTIEGIFLPFDTEGSAELEFETNFIWLPAERTHGWVSSHFDVVDQYSPAERPTDRRAYTHKLNFELDTGVKIFNWLTEGRWLRGIEIEGSLDYIATGLPGKGDVVDGARFVDSANPWSFSLVFVIPVAPL